MPIDPVCGMEVDVRTAKDRAFFQNQTYYFCSCDCKDEFEASPEAYVGGGNYGDDDLEKTGT